MTLAQIDHPFNLTKLGEGARDQVIAEGVPPEMAVYALLIFDGITNSLYGDDVEEIIAEGVRLYLANHEFEKVRKEGSQ